MIDIVCFRTTKELAESQYYNDVLGMRTDLDVSQHEDMARLKIPSVPVRPTKQIPLDDNKIILVGVCDGNAVGFAMLRRFKQEGICSGSLSSLYVMEKFRNKGIGDALIVCAKKKLADMGDEVVYLNVLANNHGAQKLYAKHGFNTVGHAMMSKLR